MIFLLIFYSRIKSTGGTEEHYLHNLGGTDDKGSVENALQAKGIDPHEHTAPEDERIDHSHLLLKYVRADPPIYVAVDSDKAYATVPGVLVEPEHLGCSKQASHCTGDYRAHFNHRAEQGVDEAILDVKQVQEHVGVDSLEYSHLKVGEKEPTNGVIDQLY